MLVVAFLTRATLNFSHEGALRFVYRHQHTQTRQKTETMWKTDS